LAISKLSLLSFRNHYKKEISFSKNITVIWGKNGSGKTSLLEAIYLLSLGKSFKTHKQKSMIKQGESSFIVKGSFLLNRIKNRIAIQTNIKNKKTIKVNGKTIKNRKEIIGKNNVVVLSPEDQVVTKGGPKERRFFFDRLFSIVNINYLKTLQEYNRVLKQRNALLSIANKNQAKETSFLLWDEKLSISAIRLWGFRKNSFLIFQKILNEVIINYQEGLSLDVVYLEKTPKKEEYQSQLEKTRDRDIFLGTTSIGPHRDKIDFFWSKKNLRDYGSQGEHKISLVLLKLAEISLIKKTTGNNPTLLLDDVFAKLDLDRSKKLVSYLGLIESKARESIQTIITTTDIVNLKQTGLTLKNKNIKSYKLEPDCNT
tara:strand:+ start:489 stop:1601 length:1113 start_codon:yes stop_codon:yes gene_type:complete